VDPHAAAAAAAEEAVRAAGEAELPRHGAAEEAAAEEAVHGEAEEAVAEEAVHGEAELSGLGAAEEAVAEELEVRSQSSEEADMRIVVRTITNMWHVLRVRPSETVGDLKTMIWHKTRKRPELQRLVCAGHFLRPDTCMLQDLHISAGSLVHVVWDQQPCLWLFIRCWLTGSFWPTMLDRDSTVRDLKTIIEGQEGIPARMQRLSFSGQILEDAVRLSQYRTLVFGCTLVLEIVDAAGEAVTRGRY